jgi:hypothetical protein
MAAISLSRVYLVKGVDHGWLIAAMGSYLVSGAALGAGGAILFGHFYRRSNKERR